MPKDIETGRASVRTSLRANSLELCSWYLIRHSCRQKGFMEVKPRTALYPQGLRVHGWVRREAGLDQKDNGVGQRVGWYMLVVP